MARINGSSGNDKLSGSATASDQIYGLAGNDTFTASGTFGDTLYGGAGDDIFNITSGTHTVADFSKGTGNSDTLNVSAGASAIVTSVLDVSGHTITGAGTVVLNGTSRNDTLVGSGIKDSINGGSGNDDISGNDGADTLLGGSGADTLNGGAGADSLDGGTGNDSLTGGADADTFADTFNVSSGTDTITDLQGTTTSADILVVSRGATAYATVSNDFEATSATKNEGRATLNLVDGKDADLSLATVTGTIGYTISAKDNANISTIEGSGGADTIIGGDAGDDITGGAGNDSLTGGAGADEFNVDAGTDTITDLQGTGSDADILIVTAGAIANVTVIDDFEATSSTTNDGTANLTLTSAAVSVDLSAVTTGTNGFKVTTSNTATTVIGSEKADSIVGGTGNDSLVGGDGGADGNDTLVGGAGNDTLVGGVDTDSMTGGAGADTFILATSDTETLSDTITDLGNGADILQVSGSGDVSATVVKNFTATADTSNGSTGTVTLTQGKGVSTINMADASGTSGYTIVKGTSGSLKATGSSAEDTFMFGNKAGLAQSTVNGGLSDDTLEFSGTVTLVDRDFRKVSSVEKLQLGDTASSVTIGNFAVAAGIDTVTGGDEADTINASSAPTAMTLDGGKGNDTITGGDEADVIDGGDDNDVITGGAGADTIVVGAGANTVNFAVADAIRATVDLTVTSPALDDGDTFNGVFDTVASLASGDVLDFLALTLTSETADGDASSGKYQTIRGDYVLDVFTVDSTGADTLVLWNDGTNGDNAVVLTGVTTLTGINIG